MWHTTTLAIFGALIAISSATWVPGQSQPNIVLLFADDMGFNDVSWNNPMVKTPNLEAMAKDGTILSNFYAQPKCSPSRASVLTGYHPVKTGFVNGALGSTQIAGLELNFKTLAEELKILQSPLKPYKSHMLGKWHLGSCGHAILPHNRGFDSFTGILRSGADHYSYNFKGALDLHTDDQANTWDVGNYSSTLYGRKASELIAAHPQGDPLFLYVAFQAMHGSKAPKDVLRRYQRTRQLRITGARKKAMAMATTIDDAVGEIKASLESAGLLDNTIFVFASDNGGNSKKGASNIPFRGGKDSWFEGGMHVPGFIYSKLFDGVRSSECMTHLVDLFATMLNMGGGTPAENIPGVSIDGVDLWDNIMGTAASCPRSGMIHNVIKTSSGGLKTGALRNGDFKYIYGDPGKNNAYIFPNGTTVRVRDEVSTHGLLFNLKDDPTESENLAQGSTLATYAAAITEYQATLSAVDVHDFITTGKCKIKQLLNSDKTAWVAGCCDGEQF